LWVWVCPWLVLTLKVLKLCTNQLVVWFVQVRVSNWCLSLFLVPISELQHAPLHLKCCELGSVPNSLFFQCFHLRFTFESIKEVGSTSKVHYNLDFSHCCWSGWSLSPWFSNRSPNIFMQVHGGELSYTTWV
jgi:hypothetical protein